ncbi:MAG: hypothetical protein PHV30_09740 [Candidatus Margulisbacteria bacterium]|nr:hypothetical protein [Candidatus Margulisiibacteriota bacterium]
MNGHIQVRELFSDTGNLSAYGLNYLDSFFPEFGELANHGRLDYSRRSHTIITLESFYKVLIGNYKGFCRIAANAGSSTFITADQFHDLQQIILKNCSTSKDLEYLFLLLLTHDFGVLHGGDSRHFVKSGVMCAKFFKSAGFDDPYICMAQKIIGNHSYFGDLFLGEASTTYGLRLYEQIIGPEKQPEHFWELLFIVNVLDINSSGDGYLSDRKYSDLKKILKINGLKKLNKKWSEERYLHLLPHKKNGEIFYLNNKQSLPSGAEKIYFQYFHYIANRLEDNQLVNMLRLAIFLLRMKSQRKLNCFEFISFSSDAEKDFHYIETLLDTSVNSEEQIILNSRNEGRVNGITFNITADDGYLDFQVG